jgi:circadian clock protein KaiB
MTDDRTFQANKDLEPETSAGVGENDEYVLRLFVSGQSPRSILAIENMRKICAEYLSERYTLEVIDIYQHPEACQQQQIVAAPTLIKVLPRPLRRIIGDLSNTEKVLVGLSLRPRTATTDKTGE